MLIQFSEIRGAERVKKVVSKRTNLDLHKRNKSSIRIISSVKINIFRKELIFKCPIIVFLAFLLLSLILSISFKEDVSLYAEGKL